MDIKWQAAAALVAVGCGMTPAHAQDAPVAQLLAELRQMRRDLGVMGLAAQRIQLVLYRLQLQQEEVREAQQRFDMATNQLRYAERMRSRGQEIVKQAEARLEAEKDPVRRQLVEQELQFTRAEVERVTREEPQARLALGEAERDLRLEQAKVREFQQKLEELERMLERLAQPQR